MYSDYRARGKGRGDEISQHVLYSSLATTRGYRPPQKNGVLFFSANSKGTKTRSEHLLLST